MKPGLLCFDLDGTLYQDKCIYPRMIDYYFQDTPYARMAEEVKTRMEAILRGEDAGIGCGCFVPKEGRPPRAAADVFSVAAAAALLFPDPGPYLDRSRFSYLGDGWTFAMYAARRIGWEGERFWERFRIARADLVGEKFGPAAFPDLRAALLGLRRRGLHLVLCSNAAQEGGRALLEKLRLADCFEELSFDADKPHSFPKRIADWSERWGVAPKDMLFVGDQGYYDLWAGKNAGARTLFVSPYPAADAVLWDMRLESTQELAAFLAALRNP